MEVANKDLIHAKTLKEILDVNIREEIYYENLFEGRHRPDLLSLGNVKRERNKQRLHRGCRKVTGLRVGPRQLLDLIL
jgi:hypothetical protein